MTASSRCSCRLYFVLLATSTIAAMSFKCNRSFLPARRVESKPSRCYLGSDECFRFRASFSKRLYLSSTDESSNSKDKTLTEAYRRGQFVFGSVALILFLMPDRTLSVKLATKLGGAAGYLLAAGLSYILAGASSAGRLSSDTYKRLNVGLLGFSLGGFLALPAEAGFFFRPSLALLLSLLLKASQVYGILISLRGWMTGINPIESSKWEPKKMLDELVTGTSSTFQGLRVENAKKALTYRNCLLLVLFGIFSSIMDGIFHIQYREAFQRTWFDVSLQWSAAARLFMISTMIFSLKDAAERDRLTGTTFIQLNVMVGLWAISVGLGQSIYPMGFMPHRGVEMFAFSLPFFIKALKSQKEKQDKRKKIPPELS